MTLDEAIEIAKSPGFPRHLTERYALTQLDFDHVLVVGVGLVALVQRQGRTMEALAADVERAAPNWTTIPGLISHSTTHSNP